MADHNVKIRGNARQGFTLTCIQGDFSESAATIQKAEEMAARHRLLMRQKARGGMPGKSARQWSGLY